EKICTLIELIESGRKGSELHLEDGVRAERFPDNLLLSRPLPKGQLRGSKQPAPAISQTIPGPGTYPVVEANMEIVLEETSTAAYHKTDDRELLLDLAKISFPLLLRSVLPGEKFHPFGGPGRKKISRYFNERQIPSKDRQAWPVLLSGDRVIAVVGLQLDHNFRITTDTRKALSIRWRDCN
ncbi:MAG: tRNA lysidine(34) synthetase TilS, partial [Proteobacteria bacterium]|nr:tRNA lysidine(34) synthetase TilS [Pseudomonadota bacterium]